MRSFRSLTTARRRLLFTSALCAWLGCTAGAPDDEADPPSGGMGGDAQGGQTAGGEAGMDAANAESGGRGGDAERQGGAAGQGEDAPAQAGTGGGVGGEGMAAGAGGTATGGMADAPAPPTGGADGIFKGPLPPLVDKTAVAPLPVTSKADQDRLVDDLERVAGNFKVERDSAGNVTYVSMIQGGFNDALAARMTTFYKLAGLHIERQKVTDTGLAFVEKMSALRRASFHYMDNATRDFMVYLKPHPDLTALEIKHNFSLAGTRVDELPAMPNLTRLVLDNGSASTRVMAFMKKAVRVQDVEIHRTDMNDDQLYDVLRMWPRLRCLELKSHRKGALALTALRAFVGHATIEQIRVTAESGARPYKYEDALEHLTRIPTLKVVQLEGNLANDFPKAFLDNLPAHVKLVTEAYPSGGTFLANCE